MSEPPNTIKTTRKNKLELSKSSLNLGKTLNEINKGRLLSISSAKLDKVTSRSLEKLSFISEKNSYSSSDFENYELEYSNYLLRKIQNHILIKNKEDKELNVKKCFVSLKLELEELLKTYIGLNKDITYLKQFLNIIRQLNTDISIGENLLKVLEENQFESVLETLLKSLKHLTSQLQLVDIDKELLEEVFSKNIWGSESEIEKCLKNIDSYTQNNKEEISKIAMELNEIKKLNLEISALKERFYLILDSTTANMLDSNYKLFTHLIRDGYKKREELHADGFQFHKENFYDIQEIFRSKLNSSTTHQMDSFQFSKLESSLLKPKSASTPQPDQLKKKSCSKE